MIPNSIYISGPMTGHDDLNFPAFNAAADALRAQGATVINPADHGVIEGAEWADYLRADLAQLSQCEAIYMLPGWTKSKGARLEHHVATELGMCVVFAEGAEHAGGAGIGRNHSIDRDFKIENHYPSMLSNTSPHPTQQGLDARITAAPQPSGLQAMALITWSFGEPEPKIEVCNWAFNSNGSDVPYPMVVAHALANLLMGEFKRNATKLNVINQGTELAAQAKQGGA